MASAAHAVVGGEADAGNQLLARLDRIPRWPFSWFSLGVIALGFLFTFYDIFNINVSFVQTCVRIQPGCTPRNAFDSLKVPLVWNLAGYVVGAMILSPLADRLGRRNMLVITMVITGLGSMYSALSGDMTHFTISRALTGVGTGADLAVVSTYLNEVAPRLRRARYTALTYVAANVGAAMAIWLGLILTTKPGHWPAGLPFAQAGPGFSDGWRWMYWGGALLALVAILLRYELPESPRWLITQRRFAHATHLIEKAEARVLAGGVALDPPVEFPVAPAPPPKSGVYREILSSPLYRKRALILLAMWTTAYVAVYSLAGGLTSLLTSFGYPQAEAGVISAIGIFGLFFARLTNPLADRIPRRVWLPMSAAIMLVGALVLTIGGRHDILLAFAGAVLLFAGNSLWVPITYSWSAELFPTRARTAGFGLVDGLGHLGGGIGVVLIAPVVIHMGSLRGMLLIVGFLVVAALIAQLNAPTAGRSLEDVSP